MISCLLPVQFLAVIFRKKFSKQLYYNTFIFLIFQIIEEQNTNNMWYVEWIMYFCKLFTLYCIQFITCYGFNFQVNRPGNFLKGKDRWYYKKISWMEICALAEYKNAEKFDLSTNQNKTTIFFNLKSHLK